MGQQPDQIAISGATAQADCAQETGAPRKIWKSPEVILGTLAEAETGSLANPDGGTGATLHAS